MDDCIPCQEQDPDVCPKSKRRCGHHCNCSWTQDECHFCGQTADENGLWGYRSSGSLTVRCFFGSRDWSKGEG